MSVSQKTARAWHSKRFANASWRIDPRIPGGRYDSGYWSREYIVLAMWTAVNDPGLCYRIQWEDGRITEHCTSWDARNDRVISVPA